MGLLLDTTIRVFVADQHPLFLAGLRACLEAAGNVNVIGDAASPMEAVRLIVETAPDIALVELDLNGLSIVDYIVRAAPLVRIIGFGDNDTGGYARSVIERGARGYVLKRSPGATLLKAITAIARGGVYIDGLDPYRADALRLALTPDLPTKRRGPTTLTAREHEVLRQIALGFTNREIAEKLGVNVKSVETYKMRASDKLRIQRRAEIVRFGITQGWFHEIAT